jgi:hypothetical protein
MLNGRTTLLLRSRPRPSDILLNPGFRNSVFLLASRKIGIIKFAANERDAREQGSYPSGQAVKACGKELW